MVAASSLGKLVFDYYGNEQTTDLLKFFIVLGKFLGFFLMFVLFVDYIF